MEKEEALYIEWNCEIKASGWYSGVVGEKTDIPNKNNVTARKYYKGLHAQSAI